DNSVLEILPDAPVFAAIIGAADERAVFVDAAPPVRPVEVMAIAVVALTYHVGLAEIPFDAPLFNVPRGEREPQTAAGGVTQRQAVLAVYLRAHRRAVGVLLFRRQRHAHAFLGKLL